MGEMNSPQSNVDLLMQRVRTEVSRRKAQADHVSRLFNFTNGNPHSDDAIASKACQDAELPVPVRLNLFEPNWRVERPTFQQMSNGQSLLKDLLAYHDRDFIHAAYLAILGRSVDPEGLEVYLRFLRGGMSKVEILGILRDSDEGQRAALKVIGLNWHYSVLKASRWPVVGSLVGLAASFLAFPEAQRQQRIFEGRTNAAIDEAQVRLQDALVVVNRALRDLENAFDQLTSYTASKASSSSLDSVDSALGQMNDAVIALRALVEKKAEGILRKGASS